MKKTFTHSNGMVDIGLKEVTRRVASASATIKMSKETFQLLMKKGSPKGNVFETAKIAGISAAKSTPQLIPMCHLLSLDKVSVNFYPDSRKNQINIVSEIVCHGKTGVEMEALTSVSVAALTIYDMMKWAEKGMRITDVKLISKSGGKSGTYTLKRN